MSVHPALEKSLTHELSGLVHHRINFHKLGEEICHEEELWLSLDHGRVAISKATTCLGSPAMVIGSRGSLGWFLGLFHWHIRHDAQKRPMSRDKPLQKKFSLTHSMVLLTPGCDSLWTREMTSFLRLYMGQLLSHSCKVNRHTHVHPTLSLKSSGVNNTPVVQLV